MTITQARIAALRHAAETIIESYGGSDYSINMTAGECLALVALADRLIYRPAINAETSLLDTVQAGLPLDVVAERLFNETKMAWNAAAETRRENVRLRTAADALCKALTQHVADRGPSSLSKSSRGWLAELQQVLGGDDA